MGEVSIMTDEELERVIKSYECELCSYCRECDYIHGNDERCQPLTDAMNGLKCGYKYGFADGYAQGEQDLMASDVVKKEFADKLEKENEQLKQQIEKMRNCRNCKNRIAMGIADALEVDPEEPCASCNGGSKWELAE